VHFVCVKAASNNAKLRFADKKYNPLLEQNYEVRGKLFNTIENTTDYEHIQYAFYVSMNSHGCLLSRSDGRMRNVLGTDYTISYDF
jgi:hypothetical protein